MAPTTATWPAQLAAPPTRRSPVASLFAPVGEGTCPTRAATRRGHLLPPSLPGSSPLHLDGATTPPRRLDLSPERSPLLCSSARTPPSPPLATTADTAIPATP